jgi:hypothetical protein
MSQYNSNRAAAAATMGALGLVPPLEGEPEADADGAEVGLLAAGCGLGACVPTLRPEASKPHALRGRALTASLLPAAPHATLPPPRASARSASPRATPTCRPSPPTRTSCSRCAPGPGAARGAAGRRCSPHLCVLHAARLQPARASLPVSAYASP